MPEASAETLQQLIDRLPNLVEHFYNDAPAPHFSRAGTGKTAPFIPPAFTNWRDEQRSWSETAALLHQSHHMPELFLDGPDALRLLERLGINTVGNFTEDRAKQFVVTTPAGHVIGDCIAYRDGPESFELVSGMPLQNWVHYQAETGGWDVKVTRDAPSNLNPAGRRVKYRFQLDGPNAGQVFAAAIDGDMPELKFFRTAHVTIKGHDVLVLRHGMAGHQGVEISGPYEEETEVMVLVWDREDVQRVYASQFGAGPRYKAIEFPVAYYAWNQFDEVRGPSGAPAGVSCHAGYINRSWTLSDSKPHPMGDAERSCAAWSGGQPRRPVAVFRHRMVAAAKPSGNPPSLTRPRRPGAQGVALTPGSIWSRPCHTCPSAHPLAISALHKCITRTQYRVREITIRRTDQTLTASCSRVTLTWGEPNGGSRKPQVEQHEQTTIKATVAPAPFTPAVRLRFREAVG
jgi:hypothetical protein